VPTPALVVFTKDSRDNILAAGASESWVVNENNAKRQRYLVCTRNAHAASFAPEEPHGAAFLVGLIKGLRHVGFDGKGLRRYAIEISQYAELNRNRIWRPEWRNPVKYTTLEELGINADKLDLKTVRPTVKRDSGPAAGSTAGIRALSISDAKQGLALKFGVPPEAIEILIRG
jgi:hypothetical protein